jgi:hypothetical protein
MTGTPKKVDIQATTIPIQDVFIFSLQGYQNGRKEKISQIRHNPAVSPPLTTAPGRVMLPSPIGISSFKKVFSIAYRLYDGSQNCSIRDRSCGTRDNVSEVPSPVLEGHHVFRV